MSERKNTFPKREERVMFGDSRTRPPQSAQNNNNNSMNNSNSNTNNRPSRSRNQGMNPTFNQTFNAKKNSNHYNNNNNNPDNYYQQEQQNYTDNNKASKKGIKTSNLLNPNSKTMRNMKSKSKKFLNKIGKAMVYLEQNIKITKQQKMIGIGAVVLLVFMMIFLRKNGTEVFVGDVSCGILKGTTHNVEQIEEMVYNQLEHDIGTAIKINEEITIRKMRVPSNRTKDYCTFEYLVPQIRDRVTYSINAANIYIDNAKTVSLATEESALGLLDDIKREYAPDVYSSGSEEGSEDDIGTTGGITTTNNTAVEFVEDVKVIIDFVPSAEVVNYDEAMMILKTYNVSMGTHTVIKGDGWFGLSLKYETSIDELKEYNNKSSSSYPILGETLKVPISRPKLSVKTVETQYITTTEPKTFTYQNDSSMAKDYQKVQQTGRSAQSVQTIEIVRINGEIQEQREISNEVTVEGIPEVIIRGTG